MRLSLFTYKSTLLLFIFIIYLFILLPFFYFIPNKLNNNNNNLYDDLPQCTQHDIQQQTQRWTFFLENSRDNIWDEEIQCTSRYFTRYEMWSCLKRKYGEDIWIYFYGDSIMRNIFKSLISGLNNTYISTLPESECKLFDIINNKNKCILWDFYFENTFLPPSSQNTAKITIRITYRAKHRIYDGKDETFFSEFDRAPRKPHAFVVNSGLWDILWVHDVAIYAKGVQNLLENFQKHLRNSQGIFTLTTSVKEHLLPDWKRKNMTNSAIIQYNIAAASTLLDHNPPILYPLDLFTLTKNGNFTSDGIHYEGPAATNLVNYIVQYICSV